MALSDCLFVNEVLAVMTAITTILFALSEWLGIKRKDTPAVTALAAKTLVKTADVVIATVSPRNSVDGERPWRRSSEMPRELHRISEG